MGAIYPLSKPVMVLGRSPKCSEELYFGNNIQGGKILVYMQQVMPREKKAEPIINLQRLTYDQT